MIFQLSISETVHFTITPASPNLVYARAKKCSVANAVAGQQLAILGQDNDVSTGQYCVNPAIQFTIGAGYASKTVQNFSYKVRFRRNFAVLTTFRLSNGLPIRLLWIWRIRVSSVKSNSQKTPSQLSLTQTVSYKVSNFLLKGTATLASKQIANKVILCGQKGMIYKMKICSFIDPCTCPDT